ncbi:MAG: hypothetical protein JO011_03045 [Ktedonobacteraceae bacterium]|nr:hypothetical protein [Ktedonobacteraceae bacterium]
MRFLVIVCLLCLLSGITSLPASGASHQACLPTVPGQLTPPPEVAGTVLINEVLLSSKKPVSCPGSTSVPGPQDTSWIELYNPMALSFNLYIVHATIDGGPGTSSMYLPFGSAIAAHGFLTIFPDKRLIFPNGAPETFTRRLLFNGNVIDQVTIPSNLGEDQSYARIPDGASKWVITNTPTIGSSNVLPPKPVRTPKSATTKKKSRSSKTSAKSKNKTLSSKAASIYAGTTITGEDNTSPDASGVQPAWRQLQLPAGASSPPTTSAAASPDDTTATSPPANNTGGDAPRNVLLTGLTVVSACALLWWWRRRRFKHS